MAPKEMDFYLGTGEVTYPPEVGRRVVYMLLCQGCLPWRSSEGKGWGALLGRLVALEVKSWSTHMFIF